MNLYNLPTFFTIGTFDQFAQGVTAGDNVATSMESLGNEYVYYRHLARFHELSLGTEALPFSEPLFYSRRRVKDPARVRYIYQESRYSSKVPGDGSVYWVSGIKQRGAGAATFDVTTLGRADELPTDQVVFDGLYENTREGYQARMRGLLRMDPDEFAATWRPEQFQDGWRELRLEVRHTELPRQEIANRFELTSTGLGAAALDLERMELHAGEPLTGSVQGDGALQLTLLGEFHDGVTATLDGEPVTAAVTAEGLVLQLVLSGPAKVLQIDP